LGWPRPAALTFIGTLNGMVFLWLALVFRLPRAHGPAIVCFAVGFLTCFHGLRGELDVAEAELGPRLLSIVTSGEGAVALVVLAVLFATLGEALARAGRWLDAICQSAAAGIAAVLALAAVVQDGWDVPLRGAFVFGLCGAGVLLLNARWRQPLLA